MLPTCYLLNALLSGWGSGKSVQVDHSENRCALFRKKFTYSHRRWDFYVQLGDCYLQCNLIYKSRSVKFLGAEFLDFSDSIRAIARLRNENFAALCSARLL